MLSDMAGDNLPMLRVRVSQNVLNKIVAILVAGNINEWNSRTVKTTFTDAIQVATQKLDTTYLQALLDHFGRKLIHAVFRSISNDMISGTTAISWSSMLADVLDAPISKLAVSDNVNAGKHLFNTGTLVNG